MRQIGKRNKIIALMLEHLLEGEVVFCNIKTEQQIVNFIQEINDHHGNPIVIEYSQQTTSNRPEITFDEYGEPVSLVYPRTKNVTGYSLKLAKI
jgi:hypothetical protein